MVNVSHGVAVGCSITPLTGLQSKCRVARSTVLGWPCLIHVQASLERATQPIRSEEAPPALRGAGFPACHFAPFLRLICVHLCSSAFICGSIPSAGWPSIPASLLNRAAFYCTFPICRSRSDSRMLQTNGVADENTGCRQARARRYRGAA